MVYCIVPVCKERTGKARKKTDIKVSFHVFPADVKRKEQWAKSIGIKVEALNEYSRICSKHFQEEMLDKTSLCTVRLRANAIPQVETSTKKNSQPFSMHNKKYSSDLMIVPEVLPVSVIMDNRESDQEIIHRTNNTSELTKEICTQTEEGYLKEYCSSTENKRSKIYCNKETSISPIRIINSPTKEILRGELRSERMRYAHKIKILKQNQRRKEKRIAVLTSIIKTLRDNKLVNEDQVELLETADPISAPHHDGNDHDYSRVTY